jgi:hypothetical protein
MFLDYVDEWEQLAASSTGKSKAKIQDDFYYAVTAGSYNASKVA